MTENPGIKKDWYGFAEQLPRFGRFRLLCHENSQKPGSRVLRQNQLSKALDVSMFPTLELRKTTPAKDSRTQRNSFGHDH